MQCTKPTCSTFANGSIFQNICVPETGDTDGVYVWNAEVFECEHDLVGAKQCSERNLRCSTLANRSIFQNIRVPETGDTDGVYEWNAEALEAEYALVGAKQWSERNLRCFIIA
jgi:hypothetical protein